MNSKSENQARLGNTNAQRHDEPMTSVLHIRCTPSQKRHWTTLANHEQVKLSEFVKRKLPAIPKSRKGATAKADRAGVKADGAKSR